MKKLLFLLIFLIASNLTAQTFIERSGGHCYTLSLPDYFMKTYELNDVATLQYMNFEREAYVIVIEDDKDLLASLELTFASAEEFLKFFVDNYKVEFENRTVSEVEKFTENNNQHAQVEVSWRENDFDYFMIITAVETKTHFYKVMCWSLQENRNLLIQDYKAISRTLKD